MADSNERIERLLVVLILQSMKGTTQEEKVKQLNICGLSNIEIAEFLNTNAAVVASLLYKSKKASKSKKR